MEPLKFKGNGMGYDVLLDGERIGYVEQYETRYNLVRVVVSKGWRSWRDERRRELVADCNTRREAAEALRAKR